MGLRWLWSVLLWFALTTTVIATAGLAAGDDSISDDTFGTAPSRVGDRGVYKTALVVVEGDQGQWVDMQARYAFERVADRVIQTPLGVRNVQSFVAEWTAQPFTFRLLDFMTIEFPSCVNDLSGNVDYGNSDPEYWEGYADQWEDCADELEDWGDELADRGEAMGEQWAEWGQAGYYAAWDEPIHRVEAGGWRVTHHDNLTSQAVATSLRSGDPALVSSIAELVGGQGVWTVPATQDGPCGWRHDLQGVAADVWSDITVHGTCPPAMEFGFARTTPTPGPQVLSVSGEDHVGDWDTTVFSAKADPDGLRLWFAQEVAYPVRILTRIDVIPPDWIQYVDNGHPPRFYILHELVDYEAGGASPGPGPVAVAGLSGARQLWGPSDAGVDHPWPLSAAWNEARARPNSDLDDWLRGHPVAAVYKATFTRTVSPDGDNEPIIDEQWHFWLSDGDDGLHAVASRHTETTTRQAPAGHPPTEVRQPVSSFNESEFDGDGLPAASDQPAKVPSIPSAAARFEATTGSAATGWEYHARCVDRCRAVDALVVIGQRPSWAPAKDLNLQVYDATGAWRADVSGDQDYPDPRFSDNAWDPRDADDDWRWSTASSGIWTWPEPKTAAGITAAAGAISLLYLLWPVLKGLGALPLFSRIRGEDLLQHPVRQGMYDLVQTHPGIHFQEMVRQMEKGRGTMEHHLRKLVAGGLLVEKSSRGFTCYFPKGAVDRRLMAAAPSLKSVGARQVLQAIHQQPGAVAQDLAQRLGMAPSTVNYHLKKLVAADLVSTDRRGRFLALYATPLGDQALGTFQT